MKRSIIRQIIKLVIQAQKLAHKIGIPNILQPGLVKEIIVADILEHELIHSKRDADACDPKDHKIKYEYLSCYEGGSGQLDRMFKSPADKRDESIGRITRNTLIYFAIFFKQNPLMVKVIYEIDPDVIVEETERQLDGSRNDISHVGFSEGWAKQNGRIVYPKTTLCMLAYHFQNLLIGIAQVNKIGNGRTWNVAGKITGLALSFLFSAPLVFRQKKMWLTIQKYCYLFQNPSPYHSIFQMDLLKRTLPAPSDYKH